MASPLPRPGAERPQLRHHRVEELLRLVVPPRLHQLPDAQVVEGVDAQLVLDVAAAAHLVVEHRRHRVVDDVEGVLEVEDVRVDVPLRRAPLDGGDVLEVGHLPEGLREDGAVRPPGCVVDHHADIYGVGDGLVVTQVVVLVRAVEYRGRYLHAYRPEVLRPLGVLDGPYRVLVVDGAHHGRLALGRLHRRAQERRPLPVPQLVALARLRCDLDDRLARDRPRLDPPLGEVGHQAEVDLEVVVERRRHRRNRPHDQLLQLGSVHCRPTSIVCRYRMAHDLSQSVLRW